MLLPELRVFGGFAVGLQAIRANADGPARGALAFEQSGMVEAVNGVRRATEFAGGLGDGQCGDRFAWLNQVGISALGNDDRRQEKRWQKWLLNGWA